MNQLKISPRARRDAKHLGLAIDRLVGSGPNGRIIAADVLKASQDTQDGFRQPLSSMRKTISRRLVESKQTVPHFYLRRTIIADTLSAFHKSQRALYPCSLNDIIVKAVAVAVQESPAFRSRIVGDDLLTLGESNIGIAVGIDGGVIVPVVLEADKLPLQQLATETKRLIASAREKRIENSGRGVFSISNLGMFDVDEFTAIVNPPESGILAVGALRETIQAKNGQPSVTTVLTLTLSCDHRVVDGMDAALFMKRLGELLETPNQLIGGSHESLAPEISVDRERGDYDVAIIGSGPAGYVAALQAATLGAKVAVIEKSPNLGGACLNAGCIPSKALLASAELLHRIKGAGALGISVADSVTADWPSIQKRKDTILRDLRRGIGDLFKSRQITSVTGHGSLDGQGCIQVANGGSSSLLTTTSIILAPGSRPAVPAGFTIDGERVATTDSALHWSTLPHRLLIVGGGVIGVEFACMMQALGVSVTVLEKMPRLLSELDADVASALQTILTKRGVVFHLGMEAKDFTTTESGCRATLSDGTIIHADRTLIAVGRRPNTDTLGLDSVGLVTERGFLRVSDDMATMAPGIYCIGDANGRCLLAHAASAQGRVAARNALGGKARLDAPMPSAVYTFPEIGSIGLTEALARDRNLPISIGKFPLRNLGKALASGHTDGFVKVIRHSDSDELLGVHAIGHSAIEFTTAAGAMMHTKAPTSELASMVFPHPSMSEALGEAAEDAYGHALHLPPKN